MLRRQIFRARIAARVVSFHDATEVMVGASMDATISLKLTPPWSIFCGAAADFADYVQWDANEDVFLRNVEVQR